MEELKETVKFMVDKELENSNKKFDSTFHTTHEGYAIIKEEVEEAEAELKNAKMMLEDCWFDIKRNTTPNRNIIAIKNCAINLSAEAIQIGAMCQKFIDSFEK